MSTYTIGDCLFGKVTILVSDDRASVTVHGEQVPEVVLRRKAGTTLDDRVPIGTRDASYLALSVNGVDALISPGAGSVTRRSYEVRAEHDGVRYRLTPSTDTASELLRDGRPVGELSKAEDGAISADWSRLDETHPQDVAIGYVLAASFGTGARRFVSMVIQGVLDAFPG
jgi:hypothetical protein